MTFLPRFLPQLFLLIALATAAHAAAPRALPEGERPDDERLGELRTLNGYFPFHQVDSVERWKERAAALRRRVRVATGLWPWPTKTPLNAVMHGRIEGEGYTVEKVYFESMPGHYVTGSLYRPAGESVERGVNDDGERPAILSPHGHWPEGRFHGLSRDEVRRLIADGAERFARGGRHPIQARAVQLARMGCIVLVYDMIGYADSVQFEHRPGVRERMNTSENWGLFSPKAALHLQTMMGLQTWNSIRAVDLMLSLDGVDPERIGATGASGGATQTLVLTAIDPRVDAAFPAVMVSTAMQGGCTCENAPYLRINGGNVDLAALTAPRPLGLTAADDWTHQLESKGYPDLQRLYEMLGRPERLTAAFHTHFPHNYNHVNRTVMYNFFNKHFSLGLDEPVLERDYEPLTREEASVWDADHPKPSGERTGDAHERALLRWWHEDAQERIDATLPTAEGGSFEEYRRVVGGGWDVILGRSIEDVGEVEYEQTKELKREDGSVRAIEVGLLTHAAEGERVPALLLHPRTQWNGELVLWITDTGRAGLLREDGSPIEPVAKLLSAGFQVAGVDLFMQGEFVKDGPKVDEQRMWYQRDGSEPWHRYAGYTFGYNPPLFARRTHDILTALHAARGRHQGVRLKGLHLVGLGPIAGPLAAAARAQAGDAIDKTAIDTAGFRFADLERFDHPMFVPGAAKYHDLPGLLALCAPHKLWLAGEGEGEQAFHMIRTIYKAADARERLHIGRQDAAAAVNWLIRQPG